MCWITICLTPLKTPHFALAARMIPKVRFNCYRNHNMIPVWKRDIIILRCV